MTGLLLSSLNPQPHSTLHPPAVRVYSLGKLLGIKPSSRDKVQVTLGTLAHVRQKIPRLVRHLGRVEEGTQGRFQQEIRRAKQGTSGQEHGDMRQHGHR